MPEERICSDCGAKLSPDTQGGLCVRCLFSLGLKTESGTEAAAPAVPITEKPGDRIGRYKLLQKIGEGGCGVVYMAEQEEPVRRKVALKVIKLGMDTREVIARFEAERQVLAMMDHPNIAKIFDAGVTVTPHPASGHPLPSDGPSPVGRERVAEGRVRDGGEWRGAGGEGLSAGRPYFVMELVRGVRITEYCDQHNLPTRERLDLFIKVCQAIQHAHQKGIIHRDIKPSNILVTINDGQPVPKVIDFGIAKATDGRLTDKTIFTPFQQFLGTPAYMSPEQAEMTSLDIDTRSDIYSLGVLLYELLTGKTPFDVKELLAAGLDTMRRAIREQEPAKPSTRLSTMAGDDLTTVAKQRHAEPPKLISLVRGDLDWIVMKCLEKDRTRRYETANGVAADVQRHLHCQPVTASPPGSAYRVQKFVRRHRTAVATTSLIAVLLVTGVVVSTSQWRRAEQNAKEKEKQRILAEKEMRRAEAAEQQMSESLREAYMSSAKAFRVSGQPGRRFNSLEALAKAAAIRPGLDLRNEAIAALALTDIRLVKPGHFSPHVAFDPTLDRYAVVNTNGDISLRKTSDDHELAFLPGDRSATDARPKFSPNGRWLAVAYEWNAMGKPPVRIRDLQQKETDWELPPHLWFQFSPDSESLALGESAGRIALYSLANRQKVKSFSFATTTTDRGKWHSEFNPTGRRLALAREGTREVKILDVKAGKLDSKLFHPTNLFGLGWHPNGKYLATACKDLHIHIWDTETGGEFMTLGGLEGLPISVQFSHSGRLLASSGWEGKTRLWSFPEGDLLCSIGGTGWLSFSPDDSRLGAVAWMQGSLALFEVAPGNEFHSLIPQGKIEKLAGAWGDVAFAPDVPFVALRQRNAVLLCDVRNGELLATNACERVQKLFRDPTGIGFFVSRDGRLIHLPARLSSHSGVLELGPEETLASLPGYKWESVTPDGKFFLAKAEGESSCMILDVNTRTGCELRANAQNAFRFVTISPGGQWVASCGWNSGKLRIWDGKSGIVLRQLTMPEAVSVLFTPDARTLVTGGHDFQFIDTATWVPGFRLSRPAMEGFPTPLSMTRDGMILAVCDTWRSVKLVQVDTGHELGSFETDNPYNISNMAISDDGAYLAIILNNAEALHMWNLRLIRRQLAAMNLDWDSPLIPIEPAAFSNAPLRLVLHTQPSTNNVPQPLVQHRTLTFPTRSPNTPTNLIDLSSFYNARLTEPWSSWSPSQSRNTLSALSNGLHTLGGTEFDVRGVAQLKAPESRQRPGYPVAIAGIPIHQFAGSMHFLHSAAWQCTTGTVIGRYVIHQEDGHDESIPLIYGKNVLEWWIHSGDTALLDTNTAVVWTGTNANHTVRLLKFTWPNPQPNVEIKAVDFISEMAESAPFLVAITAEPLSVTNSLVKPE